MKRFNMYLNLDEHKLSHKEVANLLKGTAVAVAQVAPVVHDTIIVPITTDDGTQVGEWRLIVEDH